MCLVWCGIISNLYFELIHICLFLNNLVAVQNAMRPCCAHVTLYTGLNHPPTIRIILHVCMSKISIFHHDKLLCDTEILLMMEYFKGSSISAANNVMSYS